LPFELEDIYKLVNKCFSEPTDDGYEPGYSVLMELDNNILRLEFQCVVGGFLNVFFELCLREKLMSNDAQLTINLQRIEQKQQQEFEQFTKRMEEMERRLEALGHASICFTNPPSNQVPRIQSYPINLKKLVINDGGNHTSKESFEKIKYFYQLVELEIHGLNCWGVQPNIYMSNSTVKKITINSSSEFRDIAFVKNFPSLEELIMFDISVDAFIVKTLQSIKHKIKKLTFRLCQGINQVEMQMYCTQKGIQLSIS
jgi:hypothetical protein